MKRTPLQDKIEARDTLLKAADSRMGELQNQISALHVAVDQGNRYRIHLDRLGGDLREVKRDLERIADEYNRLNNPTASLAMRQLAARVKPIADAMDSTFKMPGAG